MVEFLWLLQHFDEIPPLMSAYRKALKEQLFQSAIKLYSIKIVLVKSFSLRNSFKWMSEANMSVRPHQISRKGRKVSLVFNHLEPEDIAVHMSYLEYKSFRRLTVRSSIFK